MRNADIEQRWIDAWNQFYNLIRDVERYEIVLPDQSLVDDKGCLGFLQEAVYRDCGVDLRRYRRGKRFRIVVKAWPVGADEPPWEVFSGPGFVLDDQ